MNKDSKIERISSLFFAVALGSLLLALLLGCIAAFQFIFPGFYRSLGFIASRPIHVGLAVAWIFLSAVGGIYYYLAEFHSIQWRFPKWPLVQLLLILVTGTLIIICYANRIFGGREYWEHPVGFAIPIIVSWLLLVINFFLSIRSSKESWPVYIWMWATGIVFFLVTFIESNLWIFPYFRDHLVRDLTVQWKSYGSLVGSWNMLVYGTATFLITKLTGDEKIGRSRIAFLLYFLGFTNLLFGWAHHTYTVPSASWIRNTSYLISMTELIILAKLIWSAGKMISTNKKELSLIPARFLYVSDIWILLNLILALAISIPAVNLFTHGTHITVAHAMGSSIGINSMILLASAAFFAGRMYPEYFDTKVRKRMSIGIGIANVSLLFFWIALICAGFTKGMLMIHEKKSFGEAMLQVQEPLLWFAVSGIGILIGLSLCIIPLTQVLIKRILTK